MRLLDGKRRILLLPFQAIGWQRCAQRHFHDFLTVSLFQIAIYSGLHGVCVMVRKMNESPYESLDELEARLKVHVPKRSRRRAEDVRAKQKVKHLEKRVRKSHLHEDERFVGKQASCHSCKCSCWMCGNPREKVKGKERLTLQERRREGRTKDLQLDDSAGS